VPARAFFRLFLKILFSFRHFWDSALRPGSSRFISGCPRRILKRRAMCQRLCLA